MAKRTHRPDAPQGSPSLGLDDPLSAGAESPAVELAAETAALGDDTQLSEQVHGYDGPAETPRSRQGDLHRPYCGRHNCLMRATGSKESVTHYACPVPTCGETAKKLRPEILIPAAPMVCAHLTCESPPQYLQVDLERSTIAQLHMACPKCARGLKVPRAQFAPLLKRQRQQAAADAAEDLSAR